MAKELRVVFPELFKAQAEIVDNASRFNVVAGGHDSGLTTLAIDVALMGKYGAMHGFPVGLFAPDAESLLKIRRRVFSLIQPLLLGKLDRTRVDIVGGGSIHFYALSEKVEIWDQLAQIVIDDAVKVDGLYDVWEDRLRPLLSRYRGDAWFFSRPRGVRNGFYHLHQHGGEDGWASFNLPASSNPYADQVDLARDREEMEPDVYKQERLGKFIDSPITLSAGQRIIGKDETFRQWCQRLAEDGLKVDNIPFTIDDRPSMHFIYDQIPSSREEAFEKYVILMKCAQVGFTVMEILATIYMAIKFTPAKIGMYLPDMNLARIKSSERFMPIIRTIPAAHSLMLDGGSSEGNVMIRNMADSRFYFLWTSGKGATESVPLDILSLDEVQEMQVADMEKVHERLSASSIKFTLAGSTANWPDRDIHFLYKQGTMHQLWSKCPHCGDFHVLDDYFPECIKFNQETSDYGYVCRTCGGFLINPQHGEWRPQFPDARKISLHYPQFFSPTITARNIIEAYYNADDMKNFYNRKLGKPYTDPSQVPVNLEMLNECARLGMEAGLVWKLAGKQSFMGIDNMGGMSCAFIIERMEDGRMALTHAEQIHALDPWARLDELMIEYRVVVCVCEQLPNYDSAKQFASRHPGKVFLVSSYKNIDDDMLQWGDASLSKADRKTDEEFRDRYTVTLDQYKMMSWAFGRIQKQMILFPDPQGLQQKIIEKGMEKEVALLKDVLFLHFTRTALVTVKDDEEHKIRRKVMKVGIDPHFSFAFMMACAAWCRAHGTSSFILPGAETDKGTDMSINPRLLNVPTKVVEILSQPAASESFTCGACTAYNNDTQRCEERDVLVRKSDVGCYMFIGSSD